MDAYVTANPGLTEDGYNSYYMELLGQRLNTRSYANYNGKDISPTDPGTQRGFIGNMPVQTS
jgi:hypothetical protein